MKILFTGSNGLLGQKIAVATEKYPQHTFLEALTSPYTTSQLVRAYHDILWGQLEPQPYLINGKEVMATVEGVTENGRLALRFENKVVDTFDIDQIKWVDPN